MLNITEVKIRRTFAQEQGRLRALVSITIENRLAIHDIKVIEGPDRWFIAMPSRMTQDGKHNDVVHPIGQKVRDEMESIILAEYKKYVEKQGVVETYYEQTGEEVDESYISDYNKEKRSLDQEVARLCDLLGGHDDKQIITIYTAEFLLEFGFAAAMDRYGLTKFELLNRAYPGRFQEWDLFGYDWSKSENRRKAILHFLKQEGKPYLPTYKFFNQTISPVLDYHHKMIDFYNEVYDIDIKEEYGKILEKIRTGDAPEEELCEKHHIDPAVYRKQGETNKAPNTIHMVKVLAANGLLDRKEETKGYSIAKQ